MRDPRAPHGDDIRTAPPLMPGVVHLWVLHAELPGVVEGLGCEGALGTEETARAAAYRRPRDRQTYIAAHLALRSLLSAYTGIAPDRLDLGRAPCPRCRGRHGPPVLRSVPAHAPHFSLSHSHGLAVVALAASPVGVDVQRAVREESALRCLGALHPYERQQLTELNGHQLTLGFGELWVRKEAYLKGIGTGLCRGVAADFLGAPTPAAPPRPEGWSVHNVPLPHAGHLAATALRSTAPHRTVIHPEAARTHRPTRPAPRTPEGTRT
ncbi:4'-phosphopantetheinyl transferase superfamily protein [Streptomyces sp. CS7]|uniref:4'-phosphopantetheinyl transferase family protein n=1 Tax=Streptomyces sp. CS-7 TaxID=2906769 RepID=UPI0021B38711|nr:4'-phosphopantetheinyl transferase superfamily protein [Streptomyces sp. CS-7]MCT6780052.1 4'-phosphopantetheinyl transferase superfamily protein [Streptomyces sp. CS-7]